MAEGLAVALPLHIDSIDGAYGLHKELIDVTEQNLKMIILTSPGERVMEPNFGVGIRSYLFAQNTVGTLNAIRSSIRNQVATYLPYIVIRNLEVTSPTIFGGTAEDVDSTRINISLTYEVPAAAIVSNLTLPIEI
jgi:phage baseplate assembly protein W